MFTDNVREREEIKKNDSWKTLEKERGISYVSCINGATHFQAPALVISGVPTK